MEMDYYFRVVIRNSLCYHTAYVCQKTAGGGGAFRD